MFYPQNVVTSLRLFFVHFVQVPPLVRAADHISSPCASSLFVIHVIAVSLQSLIRGLPGSGKLGVAAQHRVVQVC